MKNQENSAPYFPMFMDLSKRTITVIGGGSRASRRVKVLLPFGPRIFVIAQDITEELKIIREEGEGEVIYLSKKFSMEDFGTPEVEEADMIVAATNDEQLNAMIANRCKVLKIPVNVVDNKALCDFFFPAVVQRGNMVAGISASGSDREGLRDLRRFIKQGMKQLFPYK